MYAERYFQIEAHKVEYFIKSAHRKVVLVRMFHLNILILGAVPVFSRVSYKFTPKIRIDVYGGTTFVNKIYIEDQDGHELFSAKTDIAPLIGLTFVARF